MIQIQIFIILKMISKLKKLFTREELLQSSFLVALIIIGLFFEIFGIAIIIPVISLLFDQDYASNNYIIKGINDFFNNLGLVDSKRIFLLFITTVFLMKTIIQTIIIYNQKKVVTRITKNLTNRLYLAYMTQPYVYYTEVNRSRIIQFLQTEMLFFFNFFESLLGFVSELIVFIGIYILILIIEPSGLIILTIAYLISGYVYYKSSNKRIRNWGKIRLNIDQVLSKLILESIGNIKNAILNNYTQKFSNYFAKQNKIKAHYSAYQLTANQFPRIYFEFVAIISIILFVFLMLYEEKDSASIIFILAIFGAASFKLLPSINKMFTHYQQINYYGSSFEKIYNELEALNIVSDLGKPGYFKFQKSIRIRDLNFSYDEKNSILKNINLEINKGDIIGIIGKSGSGKSTLINLLTGLLTPNRGEVLIDDVNIQDCIKQYQSKLGYVSQSVVLLDESIKKNIAFELDDKKIDVKKVKEVLRQVELIDWVNNLEEGLDTRVGEQGVQISGGQKQRIGIATSLFKNPEIMILDEPTSSLDENTEINILDLISNFKKEKTIIIISHKASKLKFCDKVYLINENNLNEVKI